MSNILTIGYTAEGSTDVRFLDNVIERTFTEAAIDCKGVIEVYPPQYIPTQEKAFSEKVLEAAIAADQQGLMVLCVHTDADDPSDENLGKLRKLSSFQKFEEEVRQALKKLNYL